MFKEGEYTIEVYRDNRGREPANIWINSIKDRELKARIDNKLRKLKIGNFGDCKSVEGPIFEIRLRFGSGYRIYFAKKPNTIILFLCAGDKKTQSRDIKKAKKYWDNYKLKI